MTERDMPEEMPVFPLPGTVFFPYTELPLHIFEPRYRQMVEDVLRHGRWITVALSVPAGGDGERDGYHRVASAGFLVRSARLPDGRFHIALEGRARVRLDEVPSARLYRMVRATPIPERTDWLTEADGTSRLREIVDLAAGLRLLKPEGLPKNLLPRGAARRAQLLNLLATSVVAEPTERQGMLDADYDERAALVLAQLRYSRDLMNTIAHRPPPEDPRVN